MEFSELELIPPLLRALEEEGYERPTPIQAKAVPPVLGGRDVLGCAQTGTGKTAAFALPILQRLHLGRAKPRGRRPIRALVLSPTRELAAQIGESFAAYGRHLSISSTVVFGGVSQVPQVRALERGVDVLVATPGRLIDLQHQGHVDLERLEVFVLDEADRMLDMGFIHDVRRVIATLPSERQTLFFSATMPPDIVDLADSILREPVNVSVTPSATTVELVEQTVYFVEKKDKVALLEHLLRAEAITRTLVFSRTKHGANRIVKHLVKHDIKALAIHGNKSQGARERALDGFKRGEVPVLVATDLAARGLDVDDISHVINYDIPNIFETYVHRIGRTARAGASGTAISFCQEDERDDLVGIQRLIGQVIPVVDDHPYRSPIEPPPHPDLRSRRSRERSEGERIGRSPSRRGRSRRDRSVSGTRERTSGATSAPSAPQPATLGDGAPRGRRRRRRDRAARDGHAPVGTDRR